MTLNKDIYDLANAITAKLVNENAQTIKSAEQTNEIYDHCCQQITQTLISLRNQIQLQDGLSQVDSIESKKTR